MSVAYYIVIEQPIEGFDPVDEINGKPLAHALEPLDHAATLAGLRPPLSFFSMDPTDAASFFDDCEVPEETFEELIEDGAVGLMSVANEADKSNEPPNYPPVEWFDPNEGLDSVRGLLRLLADQPALLDARSRSERDDFPTDHVITDLRDFERVLDRLVAEKVRWHMAIDL